MKTVGNVLKVLAALMFVAAAVCCVIVFWDRITQYALDLKERFRACRSGGCDGACDIDEYADWDE